MFDKCKVFKCFNFEQYIYTTVLVPSLNGTWFDDLSSNNAITEIHYDFSVQTFLGLLYVHSPLKFSSVN